MKLATWNVNSIRARLDLLVDWLGRRRPDVLCLQETKVVDELFPVDALQAIGYCAAYSGEKTYNGVALLSLEPPAGVRCDFPLTGNSEARLITGVFRGLRVYSAYFPNGRDPASPSFPLKLAWIDALGELLGARSPASPPRGSVALLGDFNVAPEARDVYDPVALEGHLHFHPDERAALQRLLARGFVDGFRLRRPEAGLYSWWDYRAGSFRRDLGLRIDHAWVSLDLAEKVVDAYIDREERARDHCSDHAPLVIDLAL